VGAGVLVGLFSAGTPDLPVVLLVQALLVLGGVYVLLAARQQSFEQIGLRAPQRADLGRALVVVLAGFGVNLLLSLAVVVLSPGTSPGWGRSRWGSPAIRRSRRCSCCSCSSGSTRRSSRAGCC